MPVFDHSLLGWQQGLGFR
jgi:hypothetical protein